MKELKLDFPISHILPITSLQCGLFTLYARRRKYELSSGYIVFNNLKEQLPFSFHHSFHFKFFFIYCYCYWLHWPCIWAFSSCSEWDHSVAGGAWVSHCAGFSFCRARTLEHLGFGLLHIKSIVGALASLVALRHVEFFSDQGS